MLDEIFDFFGEAWDYIIDFEWLSDIAEFFTGMFEDIGEFSYIGLGFGLCTTILIYALRSYMLTPFLQYMSPVSKMFWTIATYGTCIVMGYLVGKSLFDRD